MLKYKHQKQLMQILLNLSLAKIEKTQKIELQTNKIQFSTKMLNTTKDRSLSGKAPSVCDVVIGSIQQVQTKC